MIYQARHHAGAPAAILRQPLAPHQNAKRSRDLGRAQRMRAWQGARHRLVAVPGA
jgi:hypothetical protein